MSDKETIEFYNKESQIYSAKRYTSFVQSYTQYLFTKRLALFLSFLEDVEPELPENASLLEIGCADGVVMRAVEKRFPGRFAMLVGVDISPRMIEEGIRGNTNPRTTFIMRDKLSENVYDVVIELGLRISDIATELDYVSKHLKPKGYFFYSLIGKQSLHTRLKLRGVDYVDTLQTYKTYKKIIKTKFFIINSHVYGIFIPKLWAVPSLGKALQPIFDFIFQNITPELFHEKIYLLQNNTNKPKA